MGPLLIGLLFLVKAFAVARYSLTTMTSLVVTAPVQVLLGTISFYAYIVMPLVAVGTGWVGLTRHWRIRPDGDGGGDRGGSWAWWSIVGGVCVVTALMSPPEFLLTGVGLALACVQLEGVIRGFRPWQTGLVSRPVGRRHPWRWCLSACGAVAVLLPKAMVESRPGGRLEVSGLEVGGLSAAGQRCGITSADIWWQGLTLVGAVVLIDVLVSYVIEPATVIARTAGLRGWTLVYISAVAAVWYLIGFIETPWVSAQVFVLGTPVEVSVQDKTVSRREFLPERVHVLTGFPLANDATTVTTLEADTRRVVRFPVQDILAQPTCHRDLEQLGGKNSLLWVLRGRTYESHNLSCETVRESLVPPRGAAFAPAPADNLLAATGWNGALAWWSTADAAAPDRRLDQFTAPGDKDDEASASSSESGQTPYPIAFSQDGTWLAAADPAGRIVISTRGKTRGGTRGRAAPSGCPEAEAQAPATTTTSPKDSGYPGYRVVSCLPAVRTFAGAPAAVRALAFGKGGVLAAAAGDVVVLWDVAQGKDLSTIRTGGVAPGAAVNAVAFVGPHRKVLAAGGDQDFGVRLWDVSRPVKPRFLHSLCPRTAPQRSQRVPCRLTAPSTERMPDAVYAIAGSTSEDGKTTTLAVAGGRRAQARARFSEPYLANAKIYLWNLGDLDGADAPGRSGSPGSPNLPAQLGAPLTGHTGAVNALTFNPCGTLLASTGSDQTVRLWHRQDLDRPVDPNQELPLNDMRGHVTVRDVLTPDRPQRQTYSSNG